MLQDNNHNPLLSREENDYLAEIRPGQQGQVDHLAEFGDSQTVKKTVKNGQLGQPNLYLTFLAGVDWKQVYQTTLAVSATLSAIHCIGSTLRLVTRDADHSYILLALQDLPLVAVCTALAYSAVIFRRQTVFASLAALGAIACAMVIGGAA